MANPIGIPTVKIFELVPGFGIAVGPMSVSEGEQKGDHREYVMTFQAYVVKQDEHGKWHSIPN